MVQCRGHSQRAGGRLAAPGDVAVPERRRYAEALHRSRGESCSASVSIGRPRRALRSSSCHALRHSHARTAMPPCWCHSRCRHSSCRHRKWSRRRTHGVPGCHHTAHRLAISLGMPGFQGACTVYSRGAHSCHSQLVAQQAVTPCHVFGIVIYRPRIVALRAT